MPADQPTASQPQRIGIAIVSCQGRFLVGVRSHDQVLGGFAEFPGGKAKPGEDLQETAVRECREETGLAVEMERLLTTTRHQYDHGELELAFFLCRPLSGTCEPADGGVGWVEKWSLATLRFPPANAEALRALAEIGE